MGEPINKEETGIRRKKLAGSESGKNSRSEFHGRDGFVEEFAAGVEVDGAGGGEVFLGGFFIAGFAGDHGLGVIPCRSAAGGDESVGDPFGFVITVQFEQADEDFEADEFIAWVSAAHALEGFERTFDIAGKKLDLAEVEGGGEIIAVGGEDGVEQIERFLVAAHLGEDGSAEIKHAEILRGGTLQDVEAIKRGLILFRLVVLGRLAQDHGQAPLHEKRVFRACGRLLLRDGAAEGNDKK